MDPVTASVALIITQLCIAAIMAGAYAAAPAEACTRYWAMSGALTGLGIFVVIFNLGKPAGMLLALGNISLFSGCVASWLGLNWFYGKNVNRQGYILVGLFSLAFFILLERQAGFTTRGHLVSTSLILVFGLSIYTLLQHRKVRIGGKRSFARVVACTGLLLLIGAHVVRIVISLQAPGALHQASMQQLGAVVLYLMPLCGTLLFSSALLLLHFERIQSDLVHSLSAKQEALDSQLRFVDMISHEYRTPLAVIRTNLDILQSKDQSNGSKLQANLAKMRRAVLRLVEVAETGLKPERLDDASTALRCTAIFLPELLSDAMEEAATFWSERAPVLTKTDIAPLVFHGDARMLKTAILNLLDNAIKYAPAHSTVDIALTATGHVLTLTVSDNGLGIPEHELGQVFGKYFRGSRSGSTSGSGVGLYLVQRIVSQHAGSIRLENRPGGGAQATITLPFPQEGAHDGRSRYQSSTG